MLFPIYSSGGDCQSRASYLLTGHGIPNFPPSSLFYVVIVFPKNFSPLAVFSLFHQGIVYPELDSILSKD